MSAVVVVAASPVALDRLNGDTANRPSPLDDCAWFALSASDQRPNRAPPNAVFLPLLLDRIGLPDHSQFPFRYTFCSWSMALLPWVVEHLFQQGYARVICLGLDGIQPCEPKSSGPSALLRFHAILNNDQDLILADTQEAGAMRNTPAVRQYLLHLMQLRLKVAAAALAQGRVVNALVSEPFPESLRGRMCILGTDGAETDTTSMRTVSLNANGRDDRSNFDLRAAARLHALYQAILQQQPDAAGLMKFAPYMGSGLGALRVAWGLLRTPEASLSPSRWRAIGQALLKGQDLPLPPYSTDSTDALDYRQPAGSPAIHFQSHAPNIKVSELPCPSGINLAGYVNAELGLGEAARSLALACYAAGIEVTPVDLGYQTLHPQSDHAIQRHGKDLYHAIDLHYVNASHAAQTAELFRTEGPGRNRYSIGFWHWEQPDLPLDALAAFQYLDEIWAPSTFVADAIAAVAPVPVFKVPHAVDFEPSPGLTRRQFALPTDRLLVLVMYDFLSYQDRKNPQAAIAAFRTAARQHPELALVIKTINGHKHPEALARLKASVADLPGTTFIETFLSRQDTWNLQACCDILVSLHRAEGFGLAPAEMMRLGKAVVATGWSANMDFMTGLNSMPVKFDLRPLANDVGAYPAGPLWAEADVEHAAWCLSRLAGDPDLRTRLGDQAASDIRAQLSPAAVGMKVRDRLSVLGHWYPALRRPPRIDAKFQSMTAQLKSRHAD